MEFSTKIYTKHFDSFLKDRSKWLYIYLLDLGLLVDYVYGKSGLK